MNSGAFLKQRLVKNLELRFDIEDRVLSLMREFDRRDNDLYISLMYTCRDECNSLDEIMGWKIPLKILEMGNRNE